MGRDWDNWLVLVVTTHQEYNLQETQGNFSIKPLTGKITNKKTARLRAAVDFVGGNQTFKILMGSVFIGTGLAFRRNWIGFQWNRILDWTVFQIM